jgi:uncharacterized protein (DUF1778 family)
LGLRGRALLVGIANLPRSQSSTREVVFFGLAPGLVGLQRLVLWMFNSQTNRSSPIASRNRLHTASRSLSSTTNSDQQLELHSREVNTSLLDLYVDLPYSVDVSQQPPMSHQTTTRTARLEARITREALAVVRRAAEIQGRSVSEFVVAAAQEAALKTITEIEIIRLSRAAQEKFVDLLLSPPQLAPALKKAFARHRAIVKD